MNFISLINDNRYGRDRCHYKRTVFTAGIPPTLWKQQRHSAELELTFLSIVKTEANRSGEWEIPGQSMKAPRSLECVERGSNPQPLVHWWVPQRTESHAHPKKWSGPENWTWTLPITVQSTSCSVSSNSFNLNTQQIIVFEVWAPQN